VRPSFVSGRHGSRNDETSPFPASAYIQPPVMKPSPRPPLFALLSLSLFGSPAFAQTESSADPLAGVRVTELARREVWQGGRRLTFIRISPPTFPARQAPTRAAQPAPTPEQLAAEERRAAKTYHHVTLMGAVYIGDATTPTVTEIRWPRLPDSASESSETASDSTALARRRPASEARQLRAFVPFDLRHIQTFTELETADAIYGFTIFLSPVETASLHDDQRPPELALFTSASPDASRDTAAAPAYLFDGTEADAQALDATLSGLELLLAHAQENRAALAADFARVEAENAERTRQAALNPPRPKNQTIYFWKK
jgi:hypothetical protein